MGARKILTDAGIRAAFAEVRRTGRAVWKADGAIPRTYGGLQLRIEPSGVGRWYWRYTDSSGRKIRQSLGLHAFQRTPGALALPEAREAVAQKAVLYQRADSRDVREFEKRARERAEDEKQAATAAEQQRIETEQKAAEDAEKHTLEKLFAAYVAHLRKQGKSSAYDAENLFKLHVAGAHLEIARKPANAVTARDVVALLRTLTEAGKGRTAGKLRSYVRAAYAIAARAETDADAPAAFLAFGIDANPVAATATLARYNKALERALSEAELRDYYAGVKALPDSPIRDALLLGLLLGGQRTAQLVRATVPDADVKAKTLRLFDPKGRRQHARPHVLPLTDATVVVVDRCIARAAKQESPWLLSYSKDAPVRPETVTTAASSLAATLSAKAKAERVIQAPFRLRDIRRTCETALARMGISKDVRAQIQSHGLGGVQGRHYDKHDYMQEKQAALSSWARYLETEPAGNVKPIRSHGTGGI